MIEAHRILHSERGDVRLVVVGDGPLRAKYEHQIREAQRPHVLFAGRLNRSRPNHLVAGDVFCTPCNRASFGMVLLEAMSCGQPVVASRISGFQLLMQDGVQGVLVHPADYAERFAAALGRLLDDPDERRRMGEAGPPDGARALRLAAGRRQARDLLRRPARRGQACMGKRDVIVRFVIAAAVWLTVAAVIGEEIGGRPGEVVVAVAVLILMAVAWATFTPNARLFGRVVGLGSTAEPMVAITFDDGPSPEWTPGRA